MAEPFQKRYYRPDEIADLLCLSTRTVYRMIQNIDDPLPAIRVNGNGPLRVHGQDLNAYIRNHQVKPIDD